MNTLSKEEWDGLLNETEAPCVSLFLPMQHGGTDFLNSVRLKNLLREAERLLAAHGCSKAAIHEMIQPARALITDAEFWQHPSEGLAVFLAPGIVRRYRLPLGCAQTVVFGKRFHIKPLLPLWSGDGLYYILALSQNAVRLWRATRDTITEVALENAPHSLAEAMQYEESERELQLHSVGAGRNAIFHGQSVDREEEKETLRRFFRLIDHALPAELRHGKAPLVLAGVEYLFPLYAEANTNPHLLSVGIKGNPEHLHAEELRARGWECVRPIFAEAEAEAWARYEAQIGTGIASNWTEEILPAACRGRVEALFLTQETPLWGTYDPESGTVRLHSGPEDEAEDLTNLAAIETLKNGGRVYPVATDRLPAERPLAALLRY